MNSQVTDFHEVTVSGRSDVRNTARLSYFRWRWVAISVFFLLNTVNFLDRQLLAAFAPSLKASFHLSNAGYGRLISAFSFVYAIATPFAGIFVDRIGLLVSSITSVGIWSLASMATGAVNTSGGLLACRGALGLGEAAGLPLLSKANATYLKPSEWGLANALGSVGVTAGSVAAPLLAGLMPAGSQWRTAFLLTGLLGYLWIAAWVLTARRIGIPPASRNAGQTVAAGSRARLLRDRKLWRVVAAYPLVLMVFIFWLNWTTIYLVQRYHLSAADANRYFAWLPPLFVALGGSLNGWLAFRWIGRGMAGLTARGRICIGCAPIFLLTTVTPFMPSATLAILGICLTLLACQIVVSSLNIMPVDLFGPEHAAFSISLLACSYSLMQTLVSPLIGLSVDRFGFSGICVTISLLPLLGIWLVRGLAGRR